MEFLYMEKFSNILFFLILIFITFEIVKMFFYRKLRIMEYAYVKKIGPNMWIALKTFILVFKCTIVLFSARYMYFRYYWLVLYGICFLLNSFILIFFIIYWPSLGKKEIKKLENRFRPTGDFRRGGVMIILNFFSTILLLISWTKSVSFMTIELTSFQETYISILLGLFFILRIGYAITLQRRYHADSLKLFGLKLKQLRQNRSR